MKILQIYAQHWWHNLTYIVGDRDGITALRDALDGALESGHGECNVSVSDGEGFTAFIVVAEEAEIDKLPYTDEVCRSGPFVSPHELCTRHIPTLLDCRGILNHPPEEKT